MSISRKRARVLVIHVGALRGYAIPTALANAGMLEAFYTDACSGIGIGRLARIGSNIPILGEAFLRLANRTPPNEVVSRTTTADFATLLGIARERLSRNPYNLAKIRRGTWEAIGRRMRKKGVGKATHVLSVYGQGHLLLRDAKERGLKVICDVNIAPSSKFIVAKERHLFGDWEEPMTDLGDPGFLEIMIENSDHFLSPSEFVCSDLVENYGVDRKKISIVPYTVHDKWLKLKTEPVMGRVLFVGAFQLRKGAHYFAIAANRLRDKGRPYEFRAIGHAPERIKRRSECDVINFIGLVPRHRVQKEIAAADVLVLPSLAEGSAGVTYEALGAGVPVVTTQESGSVVRNGVDGFIVPSRNEIALSEAIERILEDRGLRRSMSHQARLRAQDYTLDRFEQRLTSAIKNVE